MIFFLALVHPASYGVSCQGAMPRREDDTMMKLTGVHAIDFADLRGLTLRKYADPTEGAREGLSVEEARQIAKEDPSLIWLAVETSVWSIVSAQGAHMGLYQGETSAHAYAAMHRDAGYRAEVVDGEIQTTAEHGDAVDEMSIVKVSEEA